MDYKMLVEIPIRNVPDDVSIQEAKVTSELWLKQKIEDAELVEFKRNRMEAKDRQLKCGECGQSVRPFDFHSKECCDSFKAGKKEGLRLTTVALDEAKQAGMREVVKWIDENKCQFSDRDIIMPDKWQGITEEWGL